MLLPAAAWGEKDGTVTNSERRISRQRSFLPMPGEARADWRIICEVARRMNHGDAFSFDGPAAIFREHAALSAVGNDGRRDFDIGACRDVSDEAYESLTPFQWPLRHGQPHRESRFFGDGRFFTADQRAQFITTPAVRAPTALPQGTLVLNTGRIRDQWHTMTRTAKSPRLMRQIAEPFCEIHPEDAERRGIAPASLVRVSSPRGSIVVRALVTARARRGSVFVPMHWTAQHAAQARVDALVAPLVDPISGQPGLKLTPAWVTPFAATWYGFAVLDVRPARIAADYWAVAAVPSGWRVELAGASVPDDWSAFAGSLLGAGGETLSFRDDALGRHHIARFNAGRLIGALFIDSRPVAAARDWMADWLAAPLQSHAERLRILSGRPGAGVVDAGTVVCACLGVGANTIRSAIGGGAATVAAVGAATGAGTNCGTCRTEIRRMISAFGLQEAI